MELDKDLIERFRAKFGILDMEDREWITNKDRVIGLPKPNTFLSAIYTPIGRFRLRKGINRARKRRLSLFNSQGVQSMLLFGAMTVVRRRRILELGLYKSHLLTVSNGEKMVVIAPLVSEEETYDLSLSSLIDERDLDKYREATLWFKMLKGGE